MSALGEGVTLAVGVAALVAALAGLFRWARPRYLKARATSTAVTDAILGRPAILDSITNEERVPALPGIGQRMANTEAQLAIITDAVATLADNRALIDDHEARIKVLELAAVERVVTRAESAAAWRAVEAIHTTPEETPEP